MTEIERIEQLEKEVKVLKEEIVSLQNKTVVNAQISINRESIREFSEELSKIIDDMVLSKRLGNYDK